WIIREDGIVITNNHVIEGANIINVTLDDGRTFQVFSTSVATDPIADLAVLKIGATGLPALAVGDSTKLRIGDWVVAMGNALGEGTSATNGIVSRKNASIAVDQSEMLDNLIQTNAAINAGNSGGPLLNMAGEVIGITSAKLSAVGVEGMGYAISTESAVPTIEALISTGYVIRPWLGVTLYTVDPFVIQRYRLSVDTGALIINIAAGSPAEQAGLKAGDVITKFGDKEITDDSGLIRAIHAGKVNQDIEITFWRGISQSTTHAILAESPPPE
ncbi:MAG: trypsin-like peptidase domain-containing protein, partial [Chloroflexi bacterium]|nr:trypsin-like peptidase domain-containing protein [Chloroflexota bacterium]